MPYYHVRITPKSDPSRDEVRVDITREELMERFVLPYRQGLPLVISGRTIPSADVLRIRINASERDSEQLSAVIRAEDRASPVIAIGGASIQWRAADMGEDLTDEFITGPPGSEVESTSQQVRELRPPPDTREVFVVHGRNDDSRNAIFEFLRALDLRPLEWSEAVQATGRASPHISEILDAAFSRAHAIVVLFTPDDEVRLKEELRKQSDPPYESELTGQARPNVLFEAGMAMAANEDRTVLVELGSLRPFSDIAGRHVIRLNNSPGQRHSLAKRLETAGLKVNLEGDDWLTAGAF